MNIDKAIEKPKFNDPDSVYDWVLYASYLESQLQQAKKDREDSVKVLRIMLTELIKQPSQ